MEKANREMFIENYKKVKEKIDTPVQVETPETRNVKESSEAFNEAVKGFEKTEKISAIAMLAVYGIMGIVFVASLIAVKKRKFKFAAISNIILGTLNGATMGATIGYLINFLLSSKKEDRTYCEC